MPLERPHATSCVGNSNVCPICHCLRDNHVCTSQCIRLNLRLISLKCRLRTWRFEWKFVKWSCFVSVHMCAKIGASWSSCLFVVTCRDMHAVIYTQCHNAECLIVQLCSIEIELVLLFYGIDNLIFDQFRSVLDKILHYRNRYQYRFFFH